MAEPEYDNGICSGQPKRAEAGLRGSLCNQAAEGESFTPTEIGWHIQRHVHPRTATVQVSTLERDAPGPGKHTCLFFFTIAKSACSGNDRHILHDS